MAAMPKTLRAGQMPVLTPALLALFGSDDDPIATSFQFAYVGAAAVAMFDVTREKVSQDQPGLERVPPRETLLA
jgi:hypothetical protein